jgi:hypothetical protein
MLLQNKYGFKKSGDFTVSKSHEYNNELLQKPSDSAGSAKRSSFVLTPEKVIGKIPHLDPLQ